MKTANPHLKASRSHCPFESFDRPKLEFNMNHSLSQVKSGLPLSALNPEPSERVIHLLMTVAIAGVGSQLARRSSTSRSGCGFSLWSVNNPYAGLLRNGHNSQA